jgi:hypothetical protein
MTGPSRDASTAAEPRDESRGKERGKRDCAGDYDDVELDVDDSDFFFELEPDVSDFLASAFFSDDAGLFSELELDSDDSGLAELPFDRLAPLRLSFL